MGGGEARSVRWAARKSGRLKSLRRSDEERRIRKRGVMPSWPGEQFGMEKPKRARRRKPDTAKADLEPVVQVPEGRVSGAIRNAVRQIRQRRLQT